MPSQSPLAALAAAWLSCAALASAADDGAIARQQILQSRFFTRFTMGQDAPVAWFVDTQANNGCHWDMRAQYLSGGVDWVFSWGNSTPWFFQFGNPSDSVKEGANQGPASYMMWFTWYMLSQSKNKDGLTYATDGPAKTAPANAKDPALMRDYFEMYKRLMVDLATAAPTPVVVHVEPDEWCHILLAGPTTPDPVTSWISVYHPDQCVVEVASTGMPELSDLPDTLVGYAHALKRLRDLYAPTNVLLATNPSAWDWQYTMSGTRMGQYWSEMCSDWDLAAFEFGDRDKGCPGGSSPPFGENSGICSTFANHEQWIHDFHAASGLYVEMWQVAVGNCHYLSCNQTDGHYCDNLIEHLLDTYPADSSFMDAYIAAGCVGWVFNAGQSFQTHVSDVKADGITNPAPITGNAGATSTYADDDGGYARLRGAAYYAAPKTIPYTAPYHASDTDSGTGSAGGGGSGSSGSGSKCGLGGLLGLVALTVLLSTMRRR
jgi:hypothetical protein